MSSTLTEGPTFSFAGMMAMGRIKVAWVTRLADYPNVSISDLEAADSINLSFWLMAGFDVVAEFGRRSLKWRVRSFDYITDPQNPSTVDRLLAPGSRGYLVIRYGLEATMDWAAHQTVNVFPVDLGVRNLAPSHPDEFGLIVHRQYAKVTGDPLLGVELQPASATRGGFPTVVSEAFQCSGCAAKAARA